MSAKLSSYKVIRILVIIIVIVILVGFIHKAVLLMSAIVVLKKLKIFITSHYITKPLHCLPNV